MPPVLLALLFPIIGLGFVGYLGLRLVRAFERRSAASQTLSELTARVEMLESALDEQSAQMRRLTEGQDFTAQLLKGRTSGEASR